MTMLWHLVKKLEKSDIFLPVIYFLLLISIDFLSLNIFFPFVFFISYIKDKENLSSVST